MGFSIANNTAITMTRGDTLLVNVDIIDEDGNIFMPVEGSNVRFAMKEKIDDLTPVLTKDIPIDTMTLRLDVDDTKRLAFGRYIYDIQLTTPEGDVDTFIAKATLRLTEEVH